MGILSYIKIGALIILLAGLAGAKMYWDWSRNEISTLKENVVKLNTALEQNEAALKYMKENIQKVRAANEYVNIQFQQTRKDNARLKNILSKHNLGFLASKKPKLIQKRINHGTANINRCFEIATGSPLTQEEISATKPSQINSACPEIANPNFKRTK